MDLELLYSKLYNYTVTRYKQFLLLSFTGESIDLIISEIFNTHPLTAHQIINTFSDIENNTKDIDCTEIKVIAHGGYEEWDNPYLYQGKCIYNEDYITKLSSGIYIDLFGYNEYTYNKLKKHFINNNLGAIVQATGTGKSYLIARYIFDTPLTDKIIIIAPNIIIHNEIKKALNFDYPNITFYTYQSLCFGNEKNIKADHIIIDEFHHAESEIWGMHIKNIINANPKAKVIGTSATPIRPSDNINVVDSLFNGNLINELNLSTAIDCGIITKPVIVQSIYNYDSIISDYQNKIKNNHGLSLKRKTLLQESIEQLKCQFDNYSVSNVISEYVPVNASHIIVFCSNMEDLNNIQKDVCTWFQVAGFNNVKAYSIHNERTIKENQNILAKFKKRAKGMSLLFSINMISEGLHLDNIDGAVFLRKTESYIVCLQQIGRTIKSNGKKQTVILDLVNNVSNNFSLKNSYGEISYPSSQIRKVRDETKDKINVFVDAKRIENVTTLIKNIEKIWNKKDINWEKQYEYYVNTYCNNNLNPKKGTKDYRWRWNQQAVYNKGLLSNDRISLLLKYNIITVRGKKYDEQWMVMFNHYVNTYCNNNLNPKKGTKDSRWRDTQQRYFNKGVLSNDRISLLLKYNIVYTETKNDREDKEWIKNFNHYVNTYCNNNLNPEKDTKDYNWKYNQQQNFNKGLLSNDRISLLLKYNIIYTETKEERADKQWIKNFNHYVNTYCNNNSKPINGTKDHRWRDTQQRAFNTGKLQKNRAELLFKHNIINTEKIIDIQWRKMYNNYVNTYSLNNSKPVNGTKDYNWRALQQDNFKNNILSNDKISLLLKYNIIYTETKEERADKQWIKNFNHYVNTYCNNNLNPKPHTTDYNWRTVQRQNFKKGKLTKERADLLLKHNIINN